MKPIFLALSLMFYLVMMVLLIVTIPFDAWTIYKSIPSVVPARIRVIVAVKVACIAYQAGFMPGWRAVCKEWK